MSDIQCKYRLGQMVRLKHEVDALRRMVTQIFIAETGIRYELSHGPSCSAHYEMEIADETSDGTTIGFKTTAK